MYYSYENCLEKKALFNFITGERGNGKTYGFKTQIACKNYFEKDVPAPDNAPIIDGKWTPLPKEALEIALGISDLAIAADKIAECMNEGEQKEVEGKENKSKNVEAGQE